MKEIQLTQNQVALVVDEDFERLNQFKWYAKKNGNIFYACRNLCKVKSKQTTVYMHHEVIDRPPKGMVNDHRNGRGLDNQRHNLRHVTRRQNGQNQKIINKTSQYLGVYWHKQTKKWMAKIEINGKTKYLGIFLNEHDAFEAYKQAIEKIGEKVIGEF